jgi:hypothetical protein
MAITTPTAFEATSRPRVEAPAGAQPKPVYLFAAVGVLLAVLAAQGWIRWLLSDEFNPTIRIGPDHYDHLTYLRILEAVSVASTVYLAWRFIFKPWRRHGEISFDGKLVIGMMVGYFWEPMVNYYNFTFAFNAHGVNFGTWANYIPGFTYPNQQILPDGTLYALPQYVYSGVLLSLTGAWWLRWSAKRFPALGPLSRWGALFFLLALIWMPFEYVFFILPQVWVYASVVSSLSLFDGTAHQFPVYEGLIMALFGCGVTFLRVSRDDRGRTFAEGGIDSIAPRWRNKVSVFAVSGLVCLWTGLSYFGPWTWLQVQADSTIKNAPSYVRSGICGGGSDYACPGGDVPIPSRGSVHLTPDDPRLPADVRQTQGR